MLRARFLACALVMSTFHEVLDVSSTVHFFALILLWCKVMLRIWFFSEWNMLLYIFAGRVKQGLAAPALVPVT